MEQSTINKVIGVIVIFTLLLVSGFLYLSKSSQKETSADDVPTSDDEAPHKYMISQDYEVNGDIKGLVNVSDHIVVGHYEKHVRDWGMGSNYFSEVYSFVVDQEIVGQTGHNIEVAIPHVMKVEQTIDGEPIEGEVTLPNYHKPDLNKEYILFLADLQNTDLYGPSSVPFQIEIGEDNIGEFKRAEKTEVKKQTKSGQTVIFGIEDIHLKDNISGKSKDELIKDIQDITND